MSSVQKVNEILDRLRQCFGVRDLQALAQELKMDATTFSVWRSRKKVPDHILVAVATATGMPLVWLQNGDGGSANEVNESGNSFFNVKKKQINLSNEEQALLENYRASSDAGRLAITTASAALAQSITSDQQRKKA